EGCDFATTPYAELSAAAGLGTVGAGRWVLLPEQDLPDSRRKPYAAQEAELGKHPDYRTALAVELGTALVLDDVHNHPTDDFVLNERRCTRGGRCSDTVTETEILTPRGRNAEIVVEGDIRSQVSIQNYPSLGVVLGRECDNGHGAYRGRAILRKLSE